MTVRRKVREPIAAVRVHSHTPAWLSVVRAYHLCAAALSKRLASIGVDLGAHEILINLRQSPGLGQQELARRCFTTKSNISMLVSRLEKVGLVAREVDPRDSRARKLALTTKGGALADACARIQYEIVERMTAECTASELAALQAAMQRASASLEALLAGEADE